MHSSADIAKNLSNIQIISRRKNKKKKVTKTINTILILLEFSLLILLFYLLYQWKISGALSQKYLFLLIGTIIIYSLLSIKKGLLKLSSPYGFIEEFLLIIKTVFLTSMITIGFLFLFKISSDYSRSIIIIYFLGMAFISWIIRLSKRLLLLFLARKNFYVKNTLIIGAGKVGTNLNNFLCSSKSLGYNVIGFLDDNKTDNNVKGKLNDLSRIIVKYDIDEIFITIPSERDLIYNLLKNINLTHVKVKIIPELYDLVTTKVSLDQLNTIPFIEINKSRQDYGYLFLKRMIDITLSLLGIIILSPFFLFLAVLIKLNSPGEIIFKQKRIGLNGKMFNIYKFRTMVSDAEKVLKENKQLYKKYIENNYKLEPEEDPRITKLGQFLRKTSLDELPQLINVLKGDMSLVGPRPVIEEELNEYEDKTVDFLSVKPGVTGYWQVSGRSNIGYPERVDLELYYVYNRSTMLDVKIIIKTFLIVITKKGAY